MLHGYTIRWSSLSRAEHRNRGRNYQSTDLKFWVASGKPTSRNCLSCTSSRVSRYDPVLSSSGRGFENSPSAGTDGPRKFDLLLGWRDLDGLDRRRAWAAFRFFHGDELPVSGVAPDFAGCHCSVLLSWIPDHRHLDACTSPKVCWRSDTS